MSSTRHNVKDLVRRLNVLSDIPEEGLNANRLSALRSSSGKSENKESFTAKTSEVLDASKEQEFSAAKVSNKTSTLVNSPGERGILLIPDEVTAPTSFGPNNEYKAVPSVIEYSTAKGRARVSIREATPEEARECAGTAVPIISEVPDFSYSPHPDGALQASAVQLIAPPANFKPIDVRGEKGNRVSTASTATSIRTSASSAVEQPAQGVTITETEQVAPDNASETATLSPPGPAPTLIPTKYAESCYSGKPPSTAGTWPTRQPSNSSMRSRQYYAPNMKRCSTAHSTPGSMDTSQSRFSWDLSKLDRTKNWFTRWFVEWWLLEIISWGFGAICMMIIVIMLSKVDGKSIPSWDLSISINAFISIFSGFAKSALLLPTAEALGQLKWTWFRKERKMIDFEVMDAASRGALGSMILLSKTKGITLASVGAAIILLSVPTDLFFQQIISYPTVAIIDKGANVTLDRAVIYDPSEELMYEGDTAITPWDGAMNSLVYPYWLGSGIPWDITANCPTGNCTFDPFHTLAVDFQCKTMPSDYLEFDCKNTSGEWLSTAQYQGPRKNPNVTSCGYYLNMPNNVPQLMSGYEVTSNGSVGEILATRFFSLSDILTHEIFLGGSVNFPEVQRPIVDFILATTPGEFIGAVNNATPVVTECEIHWVVKKLQATVVSGNLFEEAIETLQFSSNGSDPWNPDNPLNYRANYSMTLPDQFSDTGYSTYGFSNTTAMKVWEIWAQIAPSTYTRPAANNPITTSDVLKIFWIYNPPHLLKVYTSSLPWDAPANVTDHMAKAVSVMNQIVRRNANSQSHRHDFATGTAIKYIVIVKVRWEWITLPLLLLVIALLFLIATIIRSSKNKDQIGIWKTSALAILFNGLGEDVSKFVGEGRKDMGYTREKANALKVQLEGD
ncbi:uncharacterized protein PV09_07544 [Verruconis gallopava]|uniref:Uncharacterized protein n=1 Tax=Verruconis gallopava TaxID=253628 RepID=A0A0D2A2S2_9PEZI|nr:uncharacterized protein PV09_07544 [Verruconis gallopava]KIW01028.1 hypothetical protein PV09_07544 [Verruconis gallopava]